MDVSTWKGWEELSWEGVVPPGCRALVPSPVLPPDVTPTASAAGFFFSYSGYLLMSLYKNPLGNLQRIFWFEPMILQLWTLKGKQQSSGGLHWGSWLLRSRVSGWPGLKTVLYLHNFKNKSLNIKVADLQAWCMETALKAKFRRHFSYRIWVVLCNLWVIKVFLFPFNAPWATLLLDTSVYRGQEMFYFYFVIKYLGLVHLPGVGRQQGLC